MKNITNQMINRQTYDELLDFVKKDYSHNVNYMVKLKMQGMKQMIASYL